ncbi:hypothetical protein P691DRAFT_710333, partial [Macrolepiota fuliginosa MF-IS2]
MFFARHGMRGKWSEGEEGWCGTICSVDMGGREFSDCVKEEVVVDVVPAMPDRTMAAFLDGLSETRGNNIVCRLYLTLFLIFFINNLVCLCRTLILDCRHSVGAMRHSDDTREAESEGYVPRHVTPTSIRLRREYHRHSIQECGQCYSGRFLGQEYVFTCFAHCVWEEQFTYEHPKQPNGVFTYA